MKKFILMASVAMMTFCLAGESQAECRKNEMVCGTSCCASVNKGVLTIFGSGEMTGSPWRSLENYQTDITKIVIKGETLDEKGNVTSTGITSIKDEAFLDMEGVTSLTIGDSVTTIGQQSFWNMTGVKNLVIPDSVKIIKTQAFDHMGLRELVIPSSIETLGYAAFYTDSLQSLTIPDDLVLSENTHQSPFVIVNSKPIYCQGDLTKCKKALEKYICQPQGSSSSSFCYDMEKIKPVINPAQCTGKYLWNGSSCNRMTERQCNDYRDEDNNRKYYYNGLTCANIPRNGRIECVNKSYKLNDGYCDRIRYTPAEAAEVLHDDNTNEVTITFRK